MTQSYRVIVTVKSSISLTDAQHAFAQDLVISGKFPSVSAVVQHALETMRAARELEQAEILALRTALTDRLAQPGLSGPQAEAALAALLAETRSRPGER